jgi:hypothetical protein
LDPHYLGAIEQANGIIEEVAGSEQIAFFDFSRRFPRGAKHFADGRHVTEEGAEVKARLFAKFIHESGLIGIR